MFRALRRMPFFKVLAVAKIALLAPASLKGLDAGDRRRMSEIVHHGRHMDRSEREELRRLLGKLDPRALQPRRPRRSHPCRCLAGWVDVLRVEGGGRRRLEGETGPGEDVLPAVALLPEADADADPGTAALELFLESRLVLGGAVAGSRQYHG